MISLFVNLNRLVSFGLDLVWHLDCFSTWKKEMTHRRRCQDFYHHNRFCNHTPKFLKCAGGHLTRNCKKTLQTPDKCALCRGSPLANFSRSSKNPINAKPVKPPTVNVWEERKKQQQSKMAVQTQHIAQQIITQHNTTNPALVDTMLQLLKQMSPMLQIIQSQLTNLK
ncbi:hypothetical protein NPIL_595441 [Nephila pilipes]|uniref:Uncharacterized protein n=1 Tax=Nephila pilipes TaxID=299642 RepID=A0A8X6TAJ7_NEPPI|nr:hypothetical protein NPIL_595441 [Nephila pilipes]